jgi:hypothetical protein
MCDLQLCNERIKIEHTFVIHKVRKCEICGTDRSSLENLNLHILEEHSNSDIIDGKVTFDENIDPESLNIDSKGLYTMYLKTKEKYPAVFQEFIKYCEGPQVISSGRHEDSYLVSY